VKNDHVKEDKMNNLTIKARLINSEEFHFIMMNSKVEMIGKFKFWIKMIKIKWLLPKIRIYESKGSSGCECCKNIEILAEMQDTKAKMQFLDF